MADLVFKKVYGAQLGEAHRLELTGRDVFVTSDVSSAHALELGNAICAVLQAFKDGGIGEADIMNGEYKVVPK